MKLEDIENTIHLIDNKPKVKEGSISSAFLDDNIILDDSLLTRSCILFDNLEVNMINPNIYIQTIYKNISLDNINEKMYSMDNRLKNSNIEVAKCYDGTVDLYNYVNFVNENKVLVQEGVLIPNMIHKLPVLSDKKDSKLLTDLIYKNENNILELALSLGLIRDSKTFFVDDPYYYLIKLINISNTFNNCIVNNKIALSQKKNIIQYVCKNMNKVNKLNCIDLKKCVLTEVDITEENISSAINNLIINGFNVLVPNFPILSPEEILEVRYKLRDELTAYRIFIKDIINKYKNNQNISDEEIIYKELYTKVNDINLKLKCEKSKLFRKIVSYGTCIPTAIGVLTKGDLKSISASIAGTLIKIVCDVNEYANNKKMILKISNNMPFIFLLKAQKYKK